MKRFFALFLVAALAYSAASPASAVDFSVKGQWNMGFGLADTTFTSRYRDSQGRGHKSSTAHIFAARQRLLVQLDSAISQNLSGTVIFHIGPQKWGHAGQGGDLGADGSMAKVRQAYLDCGPFRTWPC